MQAQDATTLYLFKLWNWVETNRNRVIAGAVVVAVAAFVLWFMVSQREAKEVAAGQALTQAAFSGGYQMADAYAKVAAQYPGTTAGQRALLLNAAALFEAGKFIDAQAHPDSEFSGQALLGVATSLDAQGKTDLASGAYQRVINNSSDIAALSAAKFGLARIEESQGKLNDALALYQDVARANPSSVLGSEATMHLIELRNRMPAPAPAPAVAPAPATSGPAPAATAPAIPPKSSQ
jgi:predicted negative regulator of RcsB-dependent stress response